MRRDIERTYSTCDNLNVLRVFRFPTVTVRAKDRMRVFLNTVLRRIFGAKWDEITGQWIGLHIEELNELYSSQNTRVGILILATPR